MLLSRMVMRGGGGAPPGQELFESGTTWVVPAGVTRISAVAVSEGGDPNNSFGNVSGIGGTLAYANNISVTPGESLTITIGVSTGIQRSSTYLLRANRTGGDVGDVVNAGGANDSSSSSIPGGGGAAGYSGAGGAGDTNSPSGAGSGGGASGGVYGGGGGGVGLLGEGSSGAAATGGSFTLLEGKGGSGGTDASGAVGGTYGGGGGSGSGGAGGPGGLRIIWPGNLRQFPSTRTADE